MLSMPCAHCITTSKFCVASFNVRSLNIPEKCQWVWHQQIKILLPINIAHYKLVESMVLLVLSICYKLDELIWTVNLKVLTVKPNKKKKDSASRRTQRSIIGGGGSG